MGSCDDLNLESLNDCDYAKHGFCMWINNEPVNAIDFLKKRKEVLSVEYSAVLLNFFNALISFDRNKIAQSFTDLREFEKKCTPPDQSWLKSIQTRLFGEQRNESKKSIVDGLEREIILADTLLCSSILIGISGDVSSYIKAALVLRKAWKIYTQVFKDIAELCQQYCSEDNELGFIEFSSFNNNNRLELSSPTNSECSNWTVPSLINHNVPHHSSVITKSYSTFFQPQRTARLKKLSRHVALANFTMKTEGDISDSDFRKELNRLQGASYFGYGLLQIAFSFIPPQFKVINFLGYNGDRNTGLSCLHEAKNSQDCRSFMATIALLYYYLIIVPFFSLEHSDLSTEIDLATAILNENERFDQSALFLFFSGRRQRLKKKIKFSIMHYDAALRVTSLPRELKMLVMHELGLCLLIELNFHDARHYFNELKVSKFSKSYYAYMKSICRGAVEGLESNLSTFGESLQKIISNSSQKDGIIEKFLQNRCSFVLTEEEHDATFWKLLCYEIMYLWNLLGSCSVATLDTIIEDCTKQEESEPFLGLSQFLLGASYAVLNNYEKAIQSYKACIDICYENPSKLQLTHIPAYANYELAVILSKKCENEWQTYIQNAQIYKNFDFEHRLKLKIHSFKGS